MGGIASVLYGVVVYSLFFVTFLYAIAFTGNLPVPKTIDSGAEGPLIPALVINTLLLGAGPSMEMWDVPSGKRLEVQLPLDRKRLNRMAISDDRRLLQRSSDPADQAHRAGYERSRFEQLRGPER